jgi:hypothetical protein
MQIPQLININVLVIAIVPLSTIFKGIKSKYTMVKVSAKIAQCSAV